MYVAASAAMTSARCLSRRTGRVNSTTAKKGTWLRALADVSRPCEHPILLSHSVTLERGFVWQKSRKTQRHYAGRPLRGFRIRLMHVRHGARSAQGDGDSGFLEPVAAELNGDSRSSTVATAPSTGCE